MKVFISVVVFVFFTLTNSWGIDPSLEKFIAEGKRQYEALIKFNDHNNRNGIIGDNLYIFSVHSENAFLDNWVTYKKINDVKDPGGELYAGAFLDKLNEQLNTFNSDPKHDHKIYVCLVSGYKVYLKTEIDPKLTTQEDVLASLKKKYEESKSLGDDKARASYETYTSESRKTLAVIIDEVFKNRQPNHVIVSRVSYYQFDASAGQSSDKLLVTYLRGTSYLKCTSSKKESLTKFLNLENGSNYTVTPSISKLGASKGSELEIEGRVSKIINFFDTEVDPTKLNEDYAAAIDIDALNTKTALEREKNWSKDVDELASQIANTSALAGLDNFVVNSELCSKINLESYLEVFNVKFSHLMVRTDDGSWDTNTAVYFIVALKDVTYTIPTNEEKDRFAKEVLAKVKTLIPSIVSNKIVIVTIPIYSLVKPDGKNVGVTSCGVADTPLDIINEDFQRSVKPFEFIINAYKNVPKPYRAHVYKISVNHDVKHYVFTGKEKINRGYAAIDDIVIYKSNYLEKLDALTLPLYSGSEFSQEQMTEYLEKIKEIRKEQFKIVQEGILKENADPSNSFTAIGTPEWNSKRLKEDRIERLHPAYFYYASKGDLGQWIYDLGTLLEATEIKENDYYVFDKWVVVDPIVYGVIDIAGFIPIVENFADLGGIIYASARGNVDQLQNYTIGLMIVGGGAVLVKGVKVIVAARKADNTIQYVAKEVDDVIKEGAEARAVTFIPKDPAVEKRYLDELNIKAPNGIISPVGVLVKAKDKFIKAGLSESKRLNDLPQLLRRTDLSDEAVDGLIAVLGKVDDVNFKKLADKIDNLPAADASKFLEELNAMSKVWTTSQWTKLNDKMLDAWVMLKKSNVMESLRKNPEFLERISKMECN